MAIQARPRLEESRVRLARRPAFDGLVGILREYSTVINEHGNELVVSVLLRSAIASQLHEPPKFLRVRKFDFELVYLRRKKHRIRSDYVAPECQLERRSILTFSVWFEGVT